MSFEVEIQHTLGRILITAKVDGNIAEQWIVLDGPHIQSAHSHYVYAKVVSTGRTERLYLDRHEADQVRALQKRD